jgi:hypothetical protein
MMILKKLFKKQQKSKDSAIKQILEGEAIELDNPFVIYVATEIVSEFGDVLEQTSKFIWGVSENRLSHSKQEIQNAIDVLLKFFQNEKSWGRFKKTYPELSEILFTNRYYGALRCGYLELAKFIKDDDAQICEKAISVISKKAITKDDIIKLEKLGCHRAVEVNKEISSETHSRLKELQGKYGIQDTHPAFD